MCIICVPGEPGNKAMSLDSKGYLISVMQGPG